MDGLGIIIMVIVVSLIGYFVWILATINDKLELLIRIKLKNEDTHFQDEEMEKELEKYRDK